MFAIKRRTHQAWTKTGKRIPVTVLYTKDNVVARQDGKIQYLGFGKIDAKDLGKVKVGAMKKAGLSFGLKTTKKMQTASTKQVGQDILPSDMFVIGDIIDVQGISKGMGFAGGMKRHGFHGGPRTHGQSDRARAPGASGSGTTPGRLFRGKRMAGRGGNKTVTIENLQIVALDDANGEIWVKGVVPGAINHTVIVKKVQDGKFEGLFEKTVTSEIKAEETKTEEVQESQLVEEKKEEPTTPPAEPQTAVTEKAEEKVEEKPVEEEKK